MSQAPTDPDWDVIVVGTGVGGGVVGRALAEAGQKVLFLEKGPAGYRTEQHGLNDTIWDGRAREVRGYWPEPIHTTINGRDASFFAPLGAGVGGSSVFYAATLERPERHDLDAQPQFAHPTGGWPVSFDTMSPWYDKAADLFALSGSPDPLGNDPPPPLREPPAMSAADAALFNAFEAAGLHPYRTHTAVRNINGCQSCMGSKCPKPCKMDGRSAGVEPALASGHATLIDRCTVTRLLGSGDRIEGVEARREGQTDVFRARTYVLAGGALNSPRLLMASANDAWPEGCANSTGLVGRNLMFHLNEMIAVWPPRHAEASGPTRAISLRDHYVLKGQRMGMVQAMGVDVGYGEILHYLGQMADRSRFRRMPGLRPMLRLPAGIAAHVFGAAKIFVGLLEDMPYADNRVTFDPAAPDSICLSYTLHPELMARRGLFRKMLYRGFKGQRRVFLGLSPELNFGHPSGTLRFGSDPETSVLDADCKAHDIDNLYVSDASFMPTSMGVNPSLTIAANALRVAEAILQKGRTS
ncbi:MAG: GMC family oxidoreductase [Rhodobacteraceae bacterium]|nr:GMC family oxidoreductase [Paracoccaceae bacterium]